MALYRVDSPINREQRNNLNNTFSDILNRFSNLQRQINILAGDNEVDELIQRITDALNNADVTLADLQNALSDATQLIDDMITATTSATDAANAANQATADATQLISDMTALQGDLEQLQTSLEQSITDSTQATTGAINATTNANQAASNAQQATTNADNAANRANDAADAIEGWGQAVPYQNGTTYSKNNVVTYNGSTYQAKKDGVTSLPTVTTDWILLAQRGIDGTGAVSSVNSKLPNESGNVEVDIADIDGLQVALNSKASSTDLTTLEETVTTHLDKNSKHIAPVFNVKGYGAKGDGITDDTSAILEAIADIPDDETYWLQGGKTGGILYFPLGNYRISRQIDIDKAGVQVVGVGSNASVVSPLPNFEGDSALYFRKVGKNQPFTGLVVENIGVYMDSAQSISGIAVEKAYDSVKMSNVWIKNVGDAVHALKMIPDPDSADPVSQTILLENVIGIHKNKTATASVFLFDSCQEINLIGCKAFGTWESNLLPDYSDAPLCHGFDFINSRGISLVGCSVALNGLHAIRLLARNRPSNGLTVSGCTFESVGGILKAEGTANGYVNHVRIVSYRKEGSNDVGTQNLKGFELIKVNNSILETKDATVSIDSECIRNMIVSEDASKVTDSGLYTSVIGQTNGISNYLTLNPGIKTPKADIGTFFTEGAEQMSLGHPWSVNDTSILLKINRDGTVSKTRVVLGATDSGGVGYRVLRVPN